MEIEEIEVFSLGDLIDRLTPANPDPATGRRRDTGVYRGTADAPHPLLTSLDRLGGINPPHTKADLEEHIFRNFTRYSRPFLPQKNVSDWESLIAAQHHGLPTRLLDWTYSPLVAAHFATIDRCSGSQPVVWRLDWQRVHRFFGFPELAFRTEDLEESLGSGEKPFTPWEMFRSRGDARPFACMVEPPSLDIRIVTQTAAFTLCSETRESFSDFLARHGLEGALTKYRIPSPEISRFRDQLDLVGMDERRLFPDLEGVAAELRRYYS